MTRERSRVKNRLMADRRRWGGRLHVCEGWAYYRHDGFPCKGGLHLNEVLFTRRDIEKVRGDDRRYFWSELNCSLMCGWAHETFGHTHAYRRWFMERISAIYGGAAVANYLASAPLKIKVPRAGRPDDGKEKGDDG